MMLIRRHLGLLFGGHLLFHWIPIFFLVSGLPEDDSSAASSHQIDGFTATTQRRTGYACEGSSLTLSCDDPYIINLIRANFGRFSISTCNSQGNLDWSVNCKSPESFANIQLNCNRKNRCLLAASSAFFGDPCPGTYKYLEVHYECVPKFQRPPGFSEVVRSPSSSSIPSLDSSLPSPSSASSSFSSYDDNWSLLPQSSFSQSSPFSLNEQSLNNKPKNQSPPPIIIPTINPYRTSSPQVSSSPKIELVSEVSPSPLPIDFEVSTRTILDIDSKYDENASRIYEENLYIPPPSGSSGQLYYSNLENEGTIRILLILGSTLNSIILLIALVTLVLVRSLQTKESALIRKNVTINLLLDHLVLLLILGTYLSPNYFNTISITSVSSNTNTSTLRSLGFLVALYHYFLLVHFVWILFDLDLELHVRLSRKQFVDPSLVLGPSGPVAASVNTSSTATTASILTGGINPVKLRRYLYLTSYLIPLVVILLISWSTSTQALPMFANLCSLEARSHLASFVIASSIILTGLGLVLLLVTYSRIGLQTSTAGPSVAASPGSVGGFVYPPGLMTSADKFALNLMLNRKLKISLFCRFSLNLLAAINCTLGVVYLTYRVSTIGFLFALTNVSLGLFVFSYYCLTKENIRARYSLICSYAARHVFCLKGDSKSYLDNPHPVHHGHHHAHHPNVMHHLPLNSGLNGGLSRGIVVGAFNKNPSIQNLTGNPAQLSQPMIGNSSSMGGLSSMARDFSASRHYLASDAAATESGSDYGCRRLTPAAVAAAAAAAAAAGNGSHMATHGPTPNHFYHLYNPKQSCNPYSCHHMIEHVYECIDDEPYVAKVILPPGSTVASATLGNYRLHSMAAAAAAAGGDHGHHLHHLHHFQQTLPNHYLGYHNLESLHIRNAQFAVSTGATTSSGSATLSTTHPTATQGTAVTCSSGLIGNALPAIVSDNSGRRTIICSKSSSNLVNEGDLTNGSNAGVLGGNNDLNNHSFGGSINSGAPVLAVLGSNNRVISSFTNSQLQQQQQGINI